MHLLEVLCFLLNSDRLFFVNLAHRGQVAVRLSFALNIVLIGIKLAIVIRTGSISVIASVIDSCLDIVSGSIIFITNCLMRRKVIIL